MPRVASKSCSQLVLLIAWKHYYNVPWLIVRVILEENVVSSKINFGDGWFCLISVNFQRFI